MNSEQDAEVFGMEGVGYYSSDDYNLCDEDHGYFNSGWTGDLLDEVVQEGALIPYSGLC